MSTRPRGTTRLPLEGLLTDLILLLLLLLLLFEDLSESLNLIKT